MSSPRVLAATDLSEPADEAVLQAAALAGAGGALAVVHVLPPLEPVRMLFPQRHADDALAVGRFTARATDVLRERVARVAGRDAELFVDQGDDDAGIVRRAEGWKADVVVVAGHGRSGLARVLGGVTERVVRYAHCDVLVARPERRGPVLAATDLSEASLPAVAAGADEARRRDASFEVAHVVDFLQLEALYLAEQGTPTTYDPSKMRDLASERLDEAVRAAGVRADTIVLDGAPAAAIVREAEAISASLVVVGSRGRTGLARLLLGSVAEKVVRAAPCSVLVVRLPR